MGLIKPTVSLLVFVWHRRICSKWFWLISYMNHQVWIIMCFTEFLYKCSSQTSLLDFYISLLCKNSVDTIYSLWLDIQMEPIKAFDVQLNHTYAVLSITLTQISKAPACCCATLHQINHSKWWITKWIKFKSTPVFLQMKQQINSYIVGGGSSAVAPDIRAGDWSVGGWVEQDGHARLCVHVCVCTHQCCT